MLAIDSPELVADADEGEFGDVGGAARAVAFPVVIPRRQRLSASSDDFEEEIRKRFALSRQRTVDAFDNVVELDLLNMLRRVDPESGDAQVRECQQVVGELLAHRRE